LGFSSTVAGNVGGILLGVMGDTLFHRRLKILLVILFFFSSILFMLFTLSLPSILSTKPILPEHSWWIIIAITIGGFFLGSTNPIFLELGAEMTYPVSEGSSAAVVTLTMNVTSLIVLFAGPFIKSSASWINAIVTLSIGFCALLTIFVKEEYKRKDFDADSYRPIQ